VINKKKKKDFDPGVIFIKNKLGYYCLLNGLLRIKKNNHVFCLLFTRKKNT